jgi:FAD dependent oxidoreductase TIGR03364
MHAYFAAAAGHEVVLIEREDAPRGASIRNFGLIWVSGRRGGDELELTLRARALWEALAETVPGIGFRANGSLTIAQSEAELRVLEQGAARDDAPSRGLELLDPAAVRAVNPAIRGDVLGGLHCALDAAVEPRLVPGAIRTELEGSSRVRFLPGRHVVEIANGWARDHTGEVHAGDLVLACVGAAHRSLVGWSGDGRLQRVRLQMLETEPAPFTVTTSIADGDSLRYYPVFDLPARSELPEPSPLVEAHKIQLLLQQRLDGSLTIGDTHVYDEPFDVATTDEPYGHLLQRVEAILGTPAPAVRRRWSGVYTQTTEPGELFHYERLGDRAAVVTGAGGRGMTMSPAIAESVLTQSGLLNAAARA